MSERVYVYQDESGEWRWRKVAANGRVVGASEEGYVNKAYAMERAVEENPDATVALATEEEN